MKLPENVRVTLGATAKESFVEDIDTGEKLKNVFAIKINLDAQGKAEAKMEVTLDPVGFVFIGKPTYSLQADSLREIVKAVHGEQSSADAAALAGRILGGGHYIDADVKRLAASVLTQAPDRGGVA